MGEERIKDFRAAECPAWRWSREGEWREVAEVVVVEQPVTIYLNGQELITLLCTPEYLEDLAVGFLAGEGFLTLPQDLESVSADYQKGQVWVSAARQDLLTSGTFLKRYLSTGCGKGTGFYSFDDARRLKPLAKSLRVSPLEVLALVQRLQECSQLFRATGGVHSGALGKGEELAVFREDLGRHNAVDKIIGCCWRQKIEARQYMLAVSGRVASEILLKAAKAGIEVLVSCSAPTRLAVEWAQQLGITLIGFVRGGRFNVYTHPERIEGCSRRE